jgi:hypothetical protein
MTTQSSNPPTKTPAEILRLPAEDVPADGVSDHVIAWLARASSLAGDAGKFAVGIKGSVGALVSVRKIVWAAADSRVEVAGQWADMVNSKAQAMPEDRRPAYYRSMERDVTNYVLKQFEDSASKAADVAERFLAELESQIAAERRRSEFLTLQMAASTEALARIQLVDRELDARPVETTFDTLVSALEAEPQDRDLCLTLALAIGPWALKKLATSPTTRVAQATHSATSEVILGGALAKENAMLHKMLSMINDFRASAVDPSLLLASEIYAQLLLPSYRALIGIQSVWDYPRAEFDAGATVPDGLVRLNRWLVRNLPFGPADYATADALTVAKRMGSGGPIGWSRRVRTKEGWQRQTQSLVNKVGDGAIAATNLR